MPSIGKGVRCLSTQLKKSQGIYYFLFYLTALIRKSVLYKYALICFFSSFPLPCHHNISRRPRQWKGMIRKRGKDDSRLKVQLLLEGEHGSLSEDLTVHPGSNLQTCLPSTPPYHRNSAGKFVLFHHLHSCVPPRRLRVSCWLLQTFSTSLDANKRKITVLIRCLLFPADYKTRNNFIIAFSVFLKKILIVEIKET